MKTNSIFSSYQTRLCTFVFELDPYVNYYLSLCTEHVHYKKKYILIPGVRDTQIFKYLISFYCINIFFSIKMMFK